ncbi:MAG: prepilin-type N-terminal cleavage/methylation domain-containing protein [Betaproteobacteria bacterium]|nr:MAG: prepilin-type N-terminal cleavage/methylation domain-containing protein [Betaproteobacteria bacterium]
MLRTRTRQRGFTLVEVLVTLAVLGVLLSLGAPSLAEWLQAQQIRAATEAIVNGMQVARAEAIRRNLTVRMVLEPPTSGWTICEATVAPCDSTLLADPVTAKNVIQSRSPQEGTSNAIVTPTPAGPPPAIAVTFSPLGSVVANSDGSAVLTRVDVGSTTGTCQADGGPMRCLRVVVTGGGSVRMCDPTPGIVAPDPRACP